MASARLLTAPPLPPCTRDSAPKEIEFSVDSTASPSRLHPQQRAYRSLRRLTSTPPLILRSLRPILRLALALILMGHRPTYPSAP